MRDAAENLGEQREADKALKSIHATLASFAGTVSAAGSLPREIAPAASPDSSDLPTAYLRHSSARDAIADLRPAANLDFSIKTPPNFCCNRMDNDTLCQ